MLQIRLWNWNTDSAVNGSEENTALSGRRHRFSSVIHDEGSVTEDVDHVAQMETTDFRQLLPLFFRCRSTETKTENKLNTFEITRHSSRL